MKLKKILYKGIVPLVLTVLVMTSVLFSYNIKALAEEADFDQFLTDGKLVIYAAPPENDDWAWVLLDNFCMENFGDDSGYSADFDSFSSPYTKVTLEYRDDNYTILDSKDVDVTYVYNSDIKSSISTIAAGVPANHNPNSWGVSTYALTDMELINYFIYGTDESSMADFSGELKSYINYKNFNIDVRFGDNSPFYTEVGGPTTFKYDGTVYYICGDILTYANHVIYVEDDETDLLGAVKIRISDTFGNVGITVTDTGKTIDDFLNEENAGFVAEYNEHPEWFPEYSSADECALARMNQNYYNDDADYHFITQTEGVWYQVTIKGTAYNFAVIKDSSKVNNNINYLTSDMSTNISISTDSANLPLDTLIRVNEITSGTEYDRIKAAIEADTMESYDLTLHSNSLGGNVTSLDDGSFEVQIPISDSLKGKDLGVYYVDDSGSVTEYDVTTANGNLKFNTNHFSIYTIAVKESETTEATTAATTEATTVATTEATTAATTEQVVTTTENVPAADVTAPNESKAPTTGDSSPLKIFVALLIISSMGLAVLGRYIELKSKEK